MQLHLWSLALMALSMNTRAVRAHVVRSPFASAANTIDMEHSAAASLNSIEFGLQPRDSIPHDVPEHPHCTMKGKDSTFYMVFSKDFGRHDETSKAGCGSDMLREIRRECSDLIVNWKCIETPKGEHSSFMSFKVPIQTSKAGKECVEKAHRTASGSRQQVLHCCARGDLNCRKRNCEVYRKTHPGLKC